MIPFWLKKSLSVDGFFEVKHLKTVGSTNDFLKALSSEKAREGLVVVADEQTGGRGRLNRDFFSPKGGLYFSILMRPNSREVLDKLTVMAAVATCDAIREICGDAAWIKWVNDILIGDKKCSGILVETTENLKGFAVVGIGVNIGSGSIHESVKDIACGVTDKSRDTRWHLLIKILENLKDLYVDFDKIKIFAAYKERCSTLGRRIEVHPNNGETYIAVAEDLDDNCRLVVKDERGEMHVIDSGEVKIISTR